MPDSSNIRHSLAAATTLFARLLAFGQKESEFISLETRQLTFDFCTTGVIATISGL
ncbi:MAG: hypothetical protein ACPGIA_01565 [Luteolibacter sp.]